ncbi:maleylpyruvate isomerase family mycothiol-dependent enzyme [Streptomyces sp. NPDC002132]|uniref:maleylpyruvate isomerase family mycothiol-dependent enzyme n=1 Tax=unclassified Streptomyces TaxID=2593676 RepID=UPI0033333670
MSRDHVLEAFRQECEALTTAISGLSGVDWELPTRCAPWSVRDLLGHVCVVLDWLPGMLAAPAPDGAGISAAEYYRPGDRFWPQGNQTRVEAARRRGAAPAQGANGVEDFLATWRRADRLCRAEPAGRTVRTRHGDPMLLSDFLLTRVVEVAVHGLDLADALGHGPWLTASAGDAMHDLLLGPEQRTAAAALGWSRPHFLRLATGRAPLTGTEAVQIEDLGIHWLTLG